jgi:hypothetical protein
MEPVELFAEITSLSRAKIRLLGAVGIALVFGLVVGAVAGYAVALSFAGDAGGDDDWGALAGIFFGLVAGALVAYGMYLVVAISLIFTWLKRTNPFTYLAVFAGPPAAIFLPMYSPVDLGDGGRLLAFLVITFGSLLLSAGDVRLKGAK